MSPRLRSLVATVVLAGAVLGLFASHSLVAEHPVGLAFQAAAALLMVWARVTFGARSFHAAANPTAGGLVTTGPYRYVRHPIYASILGFLWAGASSHASISSFALAALATAAVAVRIAAEERLIAAEYAEYASYAARTKRLIPGVL